MELALDVQEKDTVITGFTLFQSLFSWNLLLMGHVPVGSLLNILVSILVFVELALDDEAGQSGHRSNKRFQSLFSWNLLLMGGSPSLGSLSTECFNPCFRGTCS